MQANLFIFGCPRSGTTLLTEILNCSDQAAILIERHSLLNRNKKLRVADYDLSIASDFLSNPCEHVDLNRQILNTLSSASSAHVLYGDKIPKLYENQSFFNDAAVQGGKIKVIATIRNVFDVCLSYKARFNSESDNWSFTPEDGVRDWNLFLERVYQIGQAFPVALFDYDNASDGFGQFDDFLRLTYEIYESLSLSPRLTPAGLEKLAQVHRIAKGSLPAFNKERSQRRLSPPEMKYLSKHANFGLYSQIAGSRENFFELRTGSNPC